MPEEHGEQYEDDLYSQVADQQLDDLERAPDIELYNAVLDACALVCHHPAVAQQRSTAITTQQGIRLALPVVGFRTRVYWSSGPPSRVEAIFPTLGDVRGRAD